MCLCDYPLYIIHTELFHILFSFVLLWPCSLFQIVHCIYSLLWNFLHWPLTKPNKALNSRCSFIVESKSISCICVNYPLWLSVCTCLSVNKWSSDISLVVKWLKLCAFTTGATGSILSLGTKILHAVWYSPPKNFNEKSEDVAPDR